MRLDKIKNTRYERILVCVHKQLKLSVCFASRARPSASINII